MTENYEESAIPDTNSPANHEQAEQLEEQLKPQNVIDLVVFGRRLRALRVIEGYDRVDELVTVLRSRYGVDVSARTVYAIERGEQMPHLDFFIACLAIFNQPYDYFWPAVRYEVIEEIKSKAKPS